MEGLLYSSRETSVASKAWRDPEKLKSTAHTMPLLVPFEDTPACPPGKGKMKLPLDGGVIDSFPVGPSMENALITSLFPMKYSVWLKKAAVVKQRSSSSSPGPPSLS